MPRRSDRRSGNCPVVSVSRLDERLGTVVGHASVVYLIAANTGGAEQWCSAVAVCDDLRLAEYGRRRQQSQSGHCSAIALDVVFDQSTEHLVTGADPEDRASASGPFLERSRKSTSEELLEIADRVFAAREDA